MDDVEGTRTFRVAGAAYDSFMGRYSSPLAVRFADAADVARGHTALDVGCGTGALTRVLVDRLGAEAVAACDPTPSFAAECAARCPGVDVRDGSAEALPFDTAVFDRVLTQLVLHFVSDPAQAADQLCRVTRPGGFVGACVWDVADGMEMLRRFWDAALAVDSTAPDEARTMRFGRQGEVVELFEQAGLVDIAETVLAVTSTYATFEELWSGFLAGVGPAGSYCVSLPDEQRRLVEHELYVRLGSPSGPITLTATARCVIGRR
jgi:SAM-dependent methyltransferase